MKQNVEQKVIRCAIYTRKSTEEGLEQEFNSLDAQREAGEAFIESQRHEGWVVVPDRYDDGGFTGGNMDRPALKRLLKDIEEGRVDCICVYKVDRLSRSLIDFTRIIEILERHHATFVSVTQQFNTTNSMGRLTLNILLSFAQFERELISERTRDKMSAARRKGKWVGGTPVLGYDIDPNGGRLIVNQEEAWRVREIFDLYLRERALLPTVQELAARGWKTKQRTTKKGHLRGGTSFDKTNLYKLLTNITYTGLIDYKGDIYRGEHEQIVSNEAFERVQKLLRENCRNGGRDVRNRYGALLKGLLYCKSCGTSMIHSYTVKGSKRYRYYVCSRAQKSGWDTCATKSVPAPEIEGFVVESIREIGKDNALVCEVLEQARKQHRQAVERLQRERKMFEKELLQLDEEIRGVVKANGARNGRTEKAAQLADLQDKMRTAEQRAIQTDQELQRIEGERIDEGDLAMALSFFDPIWDALLPKERLRVIQLLIEQVRYDGEKGKVTLTFRPAGIHTLATEAGTTPRR